MPVKVVEMPVKVVEMPVKVVEMPDEIPIGLPHTSDIKESPAAKKISKISKKSSNDSSSIKSSDNSSESSFKSESTLKSESSLKSEPPRKKQSIPKQIRNIVWNHYIGDDIIKHKCLSCKKVNITNTDFEVGHVQSEKNGGTHEINNLRPICKLCNHSMGTENMIDFVVKYGLFIG